MSSTTIWIVAIVALLVVAACVVIARRGKPGAPAKPVVDAGPPVESPVVGGDAAAAAVVAAPAVTAPPAPAPHIVAPTPIETPRPAPAPTAPAPPPPPPAPAPIPPQPPSPPAPAPAPAPAPVAPVPIRPYEPVTVTVAPAPPRPPAPVIERVLVLLPATADEWAAAEPLHLSPVQATALAMLVAPAAYGPSRVAVAFDAGFALRLARGEPGTAQAMASSAAAAAAASAGAGAVGSLEASEDGTVSNAGSAPPRPRWLDSVAATTLAANALAAVATRRHLSDLGDECRDLKTSIAAWPAKPAGVVEPRLKPIVQDAARFAREARDNYPSVVGKPAFRERIVAAHGAALEVWRDAVARSDALRPAFEPLLAAPRFGEVQVEAVLGLWRRAREAGQLLDLSIRLLAGLHTLRVAVGETSAPGDGDPLRSALSTLAAAAEQDADLAARTAERERTAKGDPYVGRGEFEANRAALRKILPALDATAATLARVGRATTAEAPGVEGRLLIGLEGNVCELRLPSSPSPSSLPSSAVN